MYIFILQVTKEKFQSLSWKVNGEVMFTQSESEGKGVSPYSKKISDSLLVLSSTPGDLSTQSIVLKATLCYDQSHIECVVHSTDDSGAGSKDLEFKCKLTKQ